METPCSLHLNLELSSFRRLSLEPPSSLGSSLGPPNSVSQFAANESSFNPSLETPSSIRLSLESPMFLRLNLEPPSSLHPSLEPPSYVSIWSNRELPQFRQPPSFIRLSLGSPSSLRLSMVLQGSPIPLDPVVASDHQSCVMLRSPKPPSSHVPLLSRRAPSVSALSHRPSFVPATSH